VMFVSPSIERGFICSHLTVELEVIIARFVEVLFQR
jgi:hypothetical protein